MVQYNSDSSLITMEGIEDTPFQVMVIIYILGVCTMLPWNFFITANSYWQYKLRNITLGNDWNKPEATLTNLQLTFMPALVIISCLTLFLFGFFTSTITKRVKEKERTVMSLAVTLVSMGVVTIMSIINTDEWQEIFFMVTLVMVFLMNAGIAMLQASTFGMVGFFPSGCIVALISGQSLAGVLSSLSQIISLLVGKEDPITSGIIYFCLADVFIIISIYAYLILRKTEFYKISKDKNEDQERTTFREYMTVLKKIFWMGFSFGLVMLVTLTMFPAVQVYVTSSYPPSKWTEIYFQPTITFLLFNLMDMIGREVSRWKQWPSHEGYMFHIVVASRVVFIPLILLCNGENKAFPTFFHNDTFYIIINFFFALSNGYFAALALVYYPRMVDKEETELAGTLMASLLGVGMVTGSFLSPFFVAIWGPNDHAPY